MLRRVALVGSSVRGAPSACFSWLASSSLAAGGSLRQTLRSSCAILGGITKGRQTAVTSASASAAAISSRAWMAMARVRVRVRVRATVRGRGRVQARVRVRAQVRVRMQVRVRVRVRVRVMVRARVRARHLVARLDDHSNNYYY